MKKLSLIFIANLLWVGQLIADPPKKTNEAPPLFFLDVTGPSESYVGSSKTYTANWTDGFGNPVSAPPSSNYTWSATGGTVTFQDQTSCIVDWGTAGASNVHLSYTSGTTYTDDVGVTVYAGPSATSATSVTASSFTANWTSATSATSYYLQLSTVSNFSSFSSYSVGGTSQNITGLSPGTLYYYRVRASSNTLGTSAYSNTMLTTTAPSPPTANAGTSITTTSFTASWSSSTGATAYSLDVSQLSNFLTYISGYQDLTVNGTSQSVSGLSPGTTYFYRVRAINGNGTSSNSSTISVLTLPSPPTIGSPSSFTASSFTANWSSVTSATSYRLDVSLSSSFSSYVSGYNNLTVAGTSASVTGLSPGTTYYYRARAVNGSGASANSGYTSALTIPAAPSANAAASITASSFTASWGVTTSATSYRLDVSTNSGFSSFVSGYNNLTVNSTSQSVTGLSAGTTYYYRVRAVNGSGTSANSNTITLLTLPAPPTVITASSQTTTSFTASWNAVTSAASYRLDVSTNSGFSGFVTGFNNLTVNATSQSVTGLTAGTTYYYRIRTVNATGTSSNSNTASTITLPSNPTATSGTSITTTSFTANWGSVTGANYYRLDVSTSSGFSSFVSGYNNLTVNSTSQSVTGLSAGTTYYYRVRAGNTSGSSTNSNTITLITLPAAPNATAASSITTGSFYANWSPSTGAASYKLDVSANSGFTSFLSGYNNLTVNATNQLVNGLSAGTTYYYRVRAVNGTGTSTNSNTISQLTLSAAPVATAASSITTNSFLANWNTSTGAASYKLDISANSGFTSFLTGYNDLTVNSTNQSVTGLSAGTTYYYRVRAVNATGTSGNSNTITSLTLPTNPTANTATSVTTNSFNTSWNSVTGAASYRLDVSANSGFTSFVTGYNNLTVNTTSQSVTGLSAGTTYYYRVRAVNGTGTSANSNTISQLTLSAAPVATAASSITANSFLANWNASIGAASYELDISANSGFTTFLTGYNDLTVNATSQSVTGLSAGTTYYYRVRTVNSTGASANSNTITTVTVPTQPTALSATSPTTTSFTANWSATTGATSYKVYVSLNNNFSSYVGSYNGLNIGNVSNTSISGLVAGTQYFFKVRAVNSTGESIDSNVISVTTIPLNPTTTSANNFTSSSFSANWQPVAGVTNYKLYVSLYNDFSSFVSTYNGADVGNVTNITLSNLTPNTLYYYKVRAVNNSGESSDSNTGSGLTKFDPTTATVATNVLVNSFTANWISVVGAQGYRLDISSDNSFNNILSAYNDYSLTQPTLNITGLASNTTYYYRVRVVNASGSSANSNTITVILYPDLNYVRTITAMKSGFLTEAELKSAPIGEALVQTEFLDGLGRPIQSVATQQSPTFADIVQPVVYDQYGRETVKYLPFTTASTGWFNYDFKPKEDANYQSNPQYTFYQTASKVAIDSNPYGVSHFETSPLNRLLEQGAPGEAWQPDDSDTYSSPADRSIKKSYEFNAANEVLLWTYTPPNTNYIFGKVNAGTAASPTYYETNQLYKNRTKDEERHEVIEYVDKLGRVVLKRVQGIAGNPSTTDSNKDVNFASTYYVYDDFGNLICVIPPEATNRLATDYYHSGSTDAVKDAFLKRWAFRYAYDSRKRMSMKQVPGAGPVYMVYDNRDRLVLTQDGNQRLANQWLFTKYDQLNRPIMTGIYSHGAYADHQTMTDLISTTNFYDVYDGSTNHGYSNTVFPTTNLEVLTVTYYDNYDFKSLWPGDYNYYNDGLSATVINGSYTQPSTEFTRVTGQVTGSEVKVLNTPNTYLKTVTYYDDRYRALQVVMDNFQGGAILSTDRTSSLYDFVGKVLKTKTTHGVGTAASRNITRRMEYDHAGRLLKTYHKYHSQDSVLLVANEYNELGQLVTKKLHSEDQGTTFKQHIDYRFNIRGWLERINNSDLTPDGNEPRDHFGMNLAYNDVISGINNAPQYNGNISATKYSTNLGFDPGLKERAYKYDYDVMSRLTAATHLEKSGSWNTSAGLHEDNIAYDLNMNMQSIRRKGADGSQMDNLAFTYTGNQLQTVTDSWDTEKGFEDGNTVGADYTYDANGNRITDKNKGITAYKYNYMNQREKVTFSDGNYLLYIYDAAGNKLSQGVYNSSNVLQKKTDYVGEFFYENDTLKYISHEEGRYNVLAGAYEYELRDHLGNNRVTFTTKEEHDEATATVETDNMTEEQAKFLRYENARRISSHLFDKTNGSAPSTTPGYAVRLNGTTNEKYGLARSFAVMPGDTVKAEVYVKYIDTNSSNWTTALNTLLSQIAGGTAPAGTVVDGGSYGSSTSSFPFPGLLNTSGSSGDGPKAYLNWLVFDQDFTLVNGGYVRMSDAAREYGQDCAHEYLSAEVPITTAGFVYVYFSNENETPVEVYYDQFAVDLRKSPVINSTDLFPYGAPAISYAREFSLKQDKLLNGKETQDELGYNVVDLGQRDIDPFVPVFPTIDRFAEKYHWMSPYQYTAGNPVLYIDVNGDSINVAEQYRNQFTQVLQSIYGSNANSFTYSASGNLIFTGNTEDFSEAELSAFNDLNGVMGETTITNVVFEKSYTITDNDGNKLTIDPSKSGGEATALVGENKISQNYVVIDPAKNVTGNVYEVTDAYYKTPIDPNGPPRFNVTSQTTSVENRTLHGLGHVIHRGQSQDKVIDFDNKTRAITKGVNSLGYYPSPLPVRKYDETHNRTVKTGVYGN